MAKNTVKQNTYKDKKASKKVNRKINLDFLHNRKFHLAIGFFLLAFSVFLLISFISYLFTGKYDQSIVEAIGDESSKNLGLESRNWLGLFGAWTSHIFIFKWFGIAAFFIPPLSILFRTGNNNKKVFAVALEIFPANGIFTTLAESVVRIPRIAD